LKQHLDGSLFLLWLAGRHAEQRAQFVFDRLRDAAFQRAINAIAFGGREFGRIRGGLQDGMQWWGMAWSREWA
jgi:hypothetical protein